MYSPHSPTRTIDGKSNSSLEGISDERVLVASKRAAEEAIAPIVKKQAKTIKRLEKQLRKSLSQPDVTKSAHRFTEYEAMVGAKGGKIVQITEGKRATADRARELAESINDRHSASSMDDVHELEGLGLTPAEFGALMVSTD
jgi:hypothetical protein